MDGGWKGGNRTQKQSKEESKERKGSPDQSITTSVDEIMSQWVRWAWSYLSDPNYKPGATTTTTTTTTATTTVKRNNGDGHGST